MSGEVEGSGVGLHTVWDLDGVVTLLLVGRIADLHPGHLCRAADPHLLRGGDLTLPAGFTTTGSHSTLITTDQRLNTVTTTNSELTDWWGISPPSINEYERRIPNNESAEAVTENSCSHRTDLWEILQVGTKSERNYINLIVNKFAVWLIKRQENGEKCWSKSEMTSKNQSHSVHCHRGGKQPESEFWLFFMTLI